MPFVFASVGCSTLLGFIFKLFPRFGVNTLQAIVVNYFVCVTCAFLHKNAFPIDSKTPSEIWFWHAVLLGGTFISGFWTAAETVKYFGVTVGAVVQKMTIAASVPFAVLAYGEGASWGKITGVLAALASIVLTNWPSTEKSQLVDNQLVTGEKAKNLEPKKPLWLPIITFVLAVVIELVFLKVNHKKWLPEGDVRFISTIFFTAGCLGFLVLLAQFFMSKKRFEIRNVAAGIALGIPNYGSILFIFLALGAGIEGSVMFPLNNVGIILASAFGSVFLFKEKLGPINWLGVLLAVAAIFLIGFF